MSTRKTPDTLKACKNNRERWSWHVDHGAGARCVRLLSKGWPVNKGADDARTKMERAETILFGLLFDDPIKTKELNAAVAALKAACTEFEKHIRKG